MGKRLANCLQLAVGMISYPMITAHTGNSSINADSPLPINVRLLRRQLIGMPYREKHKVLPRPYYPPLGIRPVLLHLTDLTVALWHS